MTDYKAGAYLLEEILSQGRAWSELIPAVLGRREAIRELFAGVEAAIFSGCGSALNAAFSAAPLFQALTGISACALPAGETYLFPEAYLPPGRKTAAILLSRSGRTSEVLRSLEYFRQRGIPTLGITCTAESPLARGSDLSLVLASATERAIAVTRSLTAMMLAGQLVSGIVAARQPFLEELHRLPEAFEARKEEFLALGRSIGERGELACYAFVGNGPFYGCAREGQLKVKEMTLLPADAYPMLDFRHGPQSNVDPQMLVTAFLSERAYPQEAAFVKDMLALGGELWAICEQADDCLRAGAQHVLELRSNLSELARLPLYMPAVQLMACYRALALNLNPDEPRHLSYWIETPG